MQPREGFLPDKGFTFTMNADDGYVMDCVVAQDGRKSVQTTDGQSYSWVHILESVLVFQVENSYGFMILTKYGRTDFTLTKLDDETFEFDISVNKNNQVI